MHSSKDPPDLKFVSLQTFLLHKLYSSQWSGEFYFKENQTTSHRIFLDNLKDGFNYNLNLSLSL